MYYIFFLIVLLIAGCDSSAPEKKTQVSKTTTESKKMFIPKSYQVGPRPSDPVCADLNGDGSMDIAVALKKQELSVLFNDSDKELLQPVRYETQPHNISLAAADIDNDGDMDLIPLTERRVGPFFINDGKGNFTSHNLPIQGFNFSWHIEAADLNNDHLPDLVISSFNESKIMTLLNKGALAFEKNIFDLSPKTEPNQGFRPPPTSMAPPSMTDTTPGAGMMLQKSPGSSKDAEKTTQSRRPVPGKGMDTGVAAPSRPLQMSPPAEEAPQAPPGMPESEQKPEKETIIIRDDNATKIPPSKQMRLQTALRRLPNGIKDFSISDINGDGFVDLLLPSYIMNAIYTGINDGKGNFEFFETSLKDQNILENTLASVALIHRPDKKLPDVAVSSESNSNIYLFENNLGKLSYKETIKTGQKAHIVRITSDDMNGDGWTDIIATFAAPIPEDTKSLIQIWINKDGNFVLGEELKSDGFGAYIATCKLSKGLPALIISNLHEETITVFRPQAK